MNGLATELRQVFSNLIVNAVDALHTSGSRLVIKVEESVHWRDLKSGGVRVLVADDGPGIRPTSRARIFEQFFTTKCEEGTGLGLWVTRAIVEKYRGTIRLKEQHRGRALWHYFLPLGR